jgi:hypothetical protein
VLVVPAIGDGAYDGGWLDALMPAIYPADARRPKPARGVPLFKSKDTVLVRPNGDPAGPATVAPGTFEFSASAAPTSNLPAPTSGYAVTWWDPRALNLGAAPSFGLRRDDLIVKTGDLFGVDDRLVAYERWRDRKADVIARASVPGVRVNRHCLGRRGRAARDRSSDRRQSGRRRDRRRRNPRLGEPAGWRAIREPRARGPRDGAAGR